LWRGYNGRVKRSNGTAGGGAAGGPTAPILKRHLRGMRRGSMSAAEYFQHRQATAAAAAAA
jgi:hypothetical protein